MSSTAELKKVKLNVTNIKSVLLMVRNVDENRKDRQDFLTKLEEEKKQNKKKKDLKNL